VGTYVDMPGASIFILIQILLLIDFAYTASAKLVGYCEDHEDPRSG
jgi:serine incorporator 1/3